MRLCKKKGHVGEHAGWASGIDRGLAGGLALLTLLLLLGPMWVSGIEAGLGPFGYFFGSEGDWLSQHVGAAENLRQTMLASDSLFPQFTTSGGTTNIYDLAYYGLFRPDVMLSCLFPALPMKVVISGYLLISMVAAVELCFYWLRKNGCAPAVAALGAALLAASSCLYHAHHQIMFVNFLPFLLLAFLGVDCIVSGGSGLFLCLSLLMVYFHSFYYGPVCLLACGIYFFYSWQNTSWQNPARDDGDSVKAWKKPFLQFLLAVALSIGLGAVLLLPTAVDILTTAKDGGIFAEETIKPIDWSLRGLLYQPYGCGLTMVSLYGLLAALGDRKKRTTAGVLLIILAVPVCWLMCNGFLYAREKILIPFIPLILLLFAQLLETVRRGEKAPPLWPLLFCLVILVVKDRQAIDLVEMVDLALLVLWAGTLRLQRRGVAAAMTALLLLVPICTSFTVSLQEKWVPADDARQSRFSAEELLDIVDRQAKQDGRTKEEMLSLYRLDSLSDGLMNANLLPTGQVQKTAMYSSMTNDLYSRFFYPVINNAISIRNRVALLPGQNPLFRYVMGVRYMVTQADQVPADAQVLAEKNGFVVAENADVLPVVYGTDAVLCRGDYERQPYPQNLAAMMAAPVVSGRRSTVHAEEGYRFSPLDTAGMCDEDGTALTGKLPRTLKEEILLLRFCVDRPGGAEISITVDGAKNKLSGASAPYPNRNYRFVYLLSSGKARERLAVESVGRCHLTEMEAWTMPQAALQDAGKKGLAVPRNCDAHRDSTTVFTGELTMKKDGWLITSYPYRQGYQLLVDGKAREIQTVNTAFVGAPLEAGDHRIVLRYIAPGFQAGLLISLGSCLLLLCWVVWQVRFMGKKKGQTQEKTEKGKEKWG